MGDIYNETTALRKHKRLLGQEVEIDDGFGVARQVGSTRGGGVCLLALICWVAGQYIATACICCYLDYICRYIVLQKRLVCDCETIVARDERGDYSRISSVQLDY